MMSGDHWSGECTSCGAENAPAASACASCGASLTVIKTRNEPDAVTLPHIGALLEPIGEGLDSTPVNVPTDAGFALAETQQFVVDPAAPRGASGDPARRSARPVPSKRGDAARKAASLVGTKLGHFRIEALIGHGGMGQVYRAVDERLQRDVALKVLPPDVAMNPEWKARLMREARSAAAVSHRNVASIYDVGEDGDRFFIAMELVEGETLRHKMASGIPLDQTVSFAAQIARGVARAHEKGVLHRDLKPDNVLVGPEGDVKILDFGLAKRLHTRDDPLAPRDVKQAEDAGASQVGFVSGTPGYMSPEQILGEDLDYRSDIFSFGVMLYEMVTGTQPFRGSVDEIFRATLSKVPPHPSEINPAVSPALEALILRCLVRWPSERLASARELVTELEFILNNLRRWPIGISLPAPDVAIRTARTALSSVIAPSEDLPPGTVTMLCAYIAEAEQLHQRYGERYVAILDRYHSILGEATARGKGFIVDFADEQAIAAFVEAPRALAAAVEAQRAFHQETWPEGASVRARIALHTGEPKLVGSRYAGLELFRASRVAEAAPGGQVVLTAATRELLQPEHMAGLALRDLGALRIKDLQYPERLFEVSIDALPEARSVVRKASGAWNKLPLQATGFIGRTSQIQEIIALLRRNDTRLVTLSGPGGTGKTRLSLEVARALLRDFPEGAVQVLLGSVTQPALVPVSIAQALEIADAPGKPLLEVLKSCIGESRVLLVLDNFEQIVAAAPILVDLLGGCPGLKILVTSREVLKVSGEREYSVPPLDVPNPAGDVSLAVVAASDSVKLFVERVRAVQPSFELNDDAAPLVASICARLEGIPLAIELAASRMKMLTLPALHKRLDDRLGFLKGTDRDRATRHQTLRAAIDWSYDLLDEPHKELLLRAAVFAGGFSIEAAEEVCGGDLDIDVFEGLSSLVDKSLLTRREVLGEPRLGMLETIREYALERLRSTPNEEAPARVRHAAHFEAVVAQMAPGVMGRDFRRCAGKLFAEADNIRATLEFALAQASQSQGMAARILHNMLWFWATYGRFEEGQAWAKRGLEATAPGGETLERALMLEVATWLSVLLGDMEAGHTYGAEGVAAWRAIGREPEAARTKVAFGLSTAAMGDLEAGVRMEQEASEICRARKDSFGTALALNMLGELARAVGDYDEALVRNEEAIAILRKIGNITTSSLLAINVGFCYLHKGDWARAAKAVIPTLELGAEFNNAFYTAFYLAVMACVAVVRQRHQEALRLFGAFGTALRSIGAAVQPTDQAEIDRYQAIATAALGEEAGAEAVAEGASISRDLAVALTIPLRS